MNLKISPVIPTFSLQMETHLSVTTFTQQKPTEVFDSDSLNTVFVVVVELDLIEM